jgi:hypothetical protein
VRVRVRVTVRDRVRARGGARGRGRVRAEPALRHLPSPKGVGDVLAVPQAGGLALALAIDDVGRGDPRDGHNHEHPVRCGTHRDRAQQAHVPVACEPRVLADVDVAVVVHGLVAQEGEVVHREPNRVELVPRQLGQEVVQALLH